MKDDVADENSKEILTHSNNLIYKKMKNLNDLTIKEYNDYATLLDEGKADGNVDIFSIMEIFDIKNPDKLNFNDFQEKWDKIKSMSLSLGKPKTIYNINGRWFKPQLKVLNLTAGQFIDLQNYLKNYKLHQVLSVFMMPTKKNIFFVFPSKLLFAFVFSFHSFSFVLFFLLLLPML